MSSDRKVGLDQFRMQDRVVLITGGSKGLGLSMAEGFAQAGANLVLCSRNPEEVAAAAKQVSDKYDRKVLGLACDVSDEAQVQQLVDRTIAEMGKIDVLINNAGINIRGPIEDLSLANLDDVMRINVTGPWLLCRAVAPHMKKAGYGRVINVSSTLGAVGVAGRTPYASSKGAVTMMTKVLSLEWAKHNITVNALCPGPFLTPMNEPIADKPETKKNILGEVPLDRWGQMEEIQGSVLFLGSDASSFVTGTTLFVDGGWTAH